MILGVVWAPERQGSLRTGRGGRVLPPNGRSSSSPGPPRNWTDDLNCGVRRFSNASSTHEGGPPHEAGRRRATGGVLEVSGSVNISSV